MMGHASSLKLAIDLMHSPSRVHSIRSAPLPNDVLVLLRIVAGDEQAISEAVNSEARSREFIREAAGFFIEQILLDPSADSYRVLGCKPETPYRDLRNNMVHLLRWLHPDGHRQNQRVVFAARVTRAWDNVKTQERRDAYDRSRRSAKPGLSSLAQRNRHSNRSRRFSESSLHSAYPLRSSRIYPHEHTGLLRRMLQLMFSWSGAWR